MDRIDIEQRIRRFVPIVLSMILAIGMGSMLGKSPYFTASLVGGVICVFFYLMMATERWWLILPAAVGFAGTFYFNFKIYPNEIALAAAVLPLGMALALHRQGLVQHRPNLPLPLYLLGGYLVLHWVGSNFYNGTFSSGGDWPGIGNVTRAYMNAAWVVIFVWLFSHWGSTRLLPQALAAIYFASFVRLCLGLVSVFFNTDALSSALHYTVIADDLRSSALSLGAVAMCYLCLTRSMFVKILHVCVFFFAAGALLLGGGRTGLAMFCLVPLWAGLIYRRVVILVTLLLVGLIAIAFLNLRPEILENLNPRAQRTLSILLINPAVADEYGKTSTSDYWHAHLREIAFSRWTESWHTFLFGVGIRPFDARVFEMDSPDPNINLENLMQAASGAGAYENSFSTITAVTGMLGLVLYLTLLWPLFWKNTGALFSDQIPDYPHAFAFLACVYLTPSLFLMWLYGGFPGLELMYGFIAVLALDDQTRQQNGDAKRDSRSRIRQNDLAFSAPQLHGSPRIVQ